jgi:hypothetical protein
MTTSKNVRSRKSASKPIPTSQVETPATPIDSAETPEINGAEAPLSIAKPAAFSLDRFKTKNLTGIANVGSLLMALPHYPISQAGDFVRLHHDESTFWSDELCFVSVPIKGMAKDVTHLIARDLVEIYLGNMLKRVKTYRLALATKPFDVFALIHVPSQHLDNPWNHDALSLVMRRNNVGSMSIAAKRKVWKATRSITRKIRTRSPSRSGRSTPSTNSSQCRSRVG